MLVTYWLFVGLLSSLFARCGHPDTSFGTEITMLFLTTGEAYRRIVQGFLLGETVSEFRAAILSETQEQATETLNHLFEDYARKLWDSLHENAFGPAASALQDIHHSVTRYYETSVVVPVTMPSASNTFSFGLSGIYIPYTATTGYMVPLSFGLVFAFVINCVIGMYCLRRWDRFTSANGVADDTADDSCPISKPRHGTAARDPNAIEHPTCTSCRRGPTSSSAKGKQRAVDRPVIPSGNADEPVSQHEALQAAQAPQVGPSTIRFTKKD